jgi:hypothetical protein
VKTLLTVDWDTFVPEKVEWDFSHQESLIFLNLLWKTRIGLKDQITTSGKEDGFWGRAGVVGGAGITWVSDSHTFVWGLLKGVDHVVLVDAHHDCWMGDSLGIDRSERRIFCHNWLREWLVARKTRKVTWVRPEWSKDMFEVPKDLADRVKIVGLDDDWGVKQIDKVHVCRSGCWTPPWLDRQFESFVLDRRQPVIKMQEGPWDPMRARWTKEEMEELVKQDRAMREKMKGMAIGSISASDFLKAREEVSVKA